MLHAYDVGVGVGGWCWVWDIPYLLIHTCNWTWDSWKTESVYGFQLKKYMIIINAKRLSKKS